MSKGKKIVFVLSISRTLHGKTIDFGKEKLQISKLYDFPKGRSKSCYWVIVALSYMLDTARVNRKTEWLFEKWFRYYKHIFIWLQLGFGKGFDSSTCTTKKFEWIGLQHAVENKDVFWNSAFIILASNESREKIHRNWTKEKISITHGQLPHKDRKGQCPEIKLTVLIVWYQYLLETFNGSFPCLLTMKFYFIFHVYCA